MSEARQKPFHDRASQEPVPVNMPNFAIDVDETHLQSPFSAGSRRYPVSAAALQDTVQSLLPDAKRWLRAAFDKCQNVSEQDRPGNVIVANTDKLNINKIRAFRKANQTCYQAHPGLCVTDPMYTSFKAFQCALSRAIGSFTFGKNLDGTILLLFSGHTQKRRADQAKRVGASDADVKATFFEMAFLSDQPERRLKHMTFTRCQFKLEDDGGCFRFGSYAGLVVTPKGTLDEYVAHMWGKVLRSKARYWHAHFLEYKDLVDELHTVQEHNKTSNVTILTTNTTAHTNVNN